MTFSITLKRKTIAFLKSTYLGEIALNILKKILITLGLRKVDIKQFFIPNKLHDVLTIKEWCKLEQLNYEIVQPIQPLTIDSPNIISEQPPTTFSSSKGMLPEIYLAHLKKVALFGGADFILTEQDKILYDEVAFDEEGKYEFRHGVVPLLRERFKSDKKLSIYQNKNLAALPSTAIHFCKDYSSNYFHWLIEGLPRMWVIDQFPALDHLPLLADKMIIPQHVEALEMMNNGKREIIYLEPSETYYIDHLIYPSYLSWMHNNYHYPVEIDRDIIISPIAIQYMRDKLLPLNQALPYRKIFVSRKKLENKRLSNYLEVEAIFQYLDFEMIYPEELSFAEQVKVFSEAMTIVATAGAGCSNILFAPKSCQIYIFITNNKNANLNIFNMIATAVGCHLSFIYGEEEVGKRKVPLHNPFKINLELIKSIFRN